MDITQIVKEAAKISGGLGFYPGEEQTFEILELDSLDRVEAIMYIEEAIGMDIPDALAESVNTIGEAIGMVKELMK